MQSVKDVSEVLSTGSQKFENVMKLYIGWGNKLGVQQTNNFLSLLRLCPAIPSLFTSFGDGMRPGLATIYRNSGVERRNLLTELSQGDSSRVTLPLTIQS